MNFDEIPYRKRFAEAVEAITGAIPPMELVDAWLSDSCDPNRLSLQDWVGSGPRVPGWVQNIAVLDAATIMADQPCEGEM